MDGLVNHLLERQAQVAPERLALVSGTDRVKYGELEVRANRLAHALIEGGVTRGDRVAIMLENGIDAVTAIFGTFKAGAAIMMLHPSSRGERLQHIVEDAAPSAFVSDDRHIDSSGLDIATHESIRLIVSSASDVAEPSNSSLVGWTQLASFPDSAPAVTAASTDLANLAYTSGSTGPPKGIMSAHRNMLAAIVAIDRYLGNRPEDVILGALPLSSSYGLYQPFLATTVGACVVLDSGITFPARTVELMEAEGVTALPGVPTHFATLLRFPSLLAGRLQTLRYLTNAGAGIPPANVKRLRELLPHVVIYSMYGMAECTRISYLPPEQVDARPDSVGIAIPGTEAFVIRDDGTRVRVGEIGELVVRGPHVNIGYWHAPELTARTFRKDTASGETLLHSGDLFSQDSDGFLYFVARRDDIIKVGGEKVAPGEVEDAVSRLESVAEVAVVGVPDELLGNVVLVTVVAKPGHILTERMVRMHCLAMLEDHMRPKHVLVVDALPQLPGGKIDKERLSREFTAPGLIQDTCLKRPMVTAANLVEEP
jgi:amino acid adenylation domain-containing protein